MPWASTAAWRSLAITAQPNRKPGAVHCAARHARHPCGTRRCGRPPRRLSLRPDASPVPAPEERWHRPPWTCPAARRAFLFPVSRAAAMAPSQRAGLALNPDHPRDYGGANDDVVVPNHCIHPMPISPHLLRSGDSLDLAQQPPGQFHFLQASGRGIQAASAASLRARARNTAKQIASSSARSRASSIVGRLAASSAFSERPRCITASTTRVASTRTATPACVVTATPGRVAR